MSEEEKWHCRHCRSTHPHHSINSTYREIEIDVTCRSVYLLFTDDSDDLGMTFTHDEFEEIIEHYENRPPFDDV